MSQIKEALEKVQKRISDIFKELEINGGFGKDISPVERLDLCICTKTRKSVKEVTTEIMHTSLRQRHPVRIKPVL